MNHLSENNNCLGKHYLRNLEYDHAIFWFEEEIGKGNNNIDLYFYLGIAYLLKRDKETAESIWMSILLETQDLQKNFERLLFLLNQEGTEAFHHSFFDNSLLICNQIHELIAEEKETKPHWGRYYYNYGVILGISGYQNQAMWAYSRAIEIDPNFAMAYVNLGILYFDERNPSNNPEKAEALYRQAIAIDSQCSLAYTNLFYLLHYQGRNEELQDFLKTTAKLFPDNLLWALRESFTLPFIYDSQAEIEIYRQRFIKGLKTIKSKIDFSQANMDNVQCLIQHQNFYLAYQGLNDVEIQKSYGQILQRVMEVNYPQFFFDTNFQEKLSDQNKELKKIRIGYISHCFCNHTVGGLAIGWFKHFDKNQFEIYCYYLQSNKDRYTQEFIVHSDYFHFLPTPPNAIETIAQQIKKDQLDILVFVDIGMYPIVNLIASLRLAPVQCTTWLHPVTSGIPNIDYFLSSDLMEGENAVQHYSETLIRLPNIGICYEKPKINPPKKTRQDFGFPEDKIIYFSSQSLFKHLPKYDYLFAAIAQKLNDARFVFINRPNLKIAERFKHRLKKVFTEFDLRMEDYCLFILPIHGERFFDLNLACDVFLDSLTWSGGKTALEALSCNLPVVTCPGEFMRGRHSYGILKMLGAIEL